MARKKLTDFKVAFDKQGKLHLPLAHRPGTYNEKQHLLLDNRVFYSVLEYEGYSLGGSAVNFVWRDLATGKELHSGLGLMQDILSGVKTTPLKVKLVEGGALRISGDFTFVKRGTATLITYHEEGK